MFSSYVRSAIHKAQAMEVVPRLTPLQIEAMDHLDALAADPQIHLDMNLAPGDMQFVSHLPTNVSSLGNSQALAREYFAHAAGIKFTDIGYKSGVTWIADLVNGSLVFSSTPINPILSLIQSGQLRVLASTGPNRTPLTPTLTEQGLPMEADGWYGVFVPAGVPDSIVSRLNQTITAILTSQDMQDILRAQHIASPPIKSPEEFARSVDQDIETWRNAVKKAGLAQS